MRRHLLENIHQAGTILRSDGSKVTTCLARLQVWHEYPAPEVAGLIEVDGDIVDLADGVDIYALIGADLVLQLHDGRSLPFFFMDSLGRIASRGALAKGGA